MRWQIAVSCLFASAGLLLGQGQGAVPILNMPHPPIPAQTEGTIQMYGAAGSEDSVGPGDLLDVRVFNQDQLSGTARVSSDGTVDLPFVGSISVAGERPEEIEKKLVTRYSTILKSPLVSVRVLEVNSRHVSVTGMVPRPGTYGYSGTITVMDALAMAGGIDPVHGPTSIYLLHSPPPVQHQNAEGNTVISVNSVLETIPLAKLYTDPQFNKIIRPGDVLEVPEAERVYVAGDVIKPGDQLMRPGLTVDQVIASAGGFLPQANHGKVKILRKIPNGTGRRELIVDVGKIQSDKRPDVPIEADDIVLVPGDMWKNAGLAVLDVFWGFGRWPIQSTAYNAIP
jgi:polysaccharide export outer membrane protein